MALLVTAGVGFLQAAILFGRKAPLLVSLYANSGVETRLAVYGFLANFGARRFPKGERKALWCARRRIPLAMVGKDAPTTAREWDLPSHGALTLFFRWRKKSAQKKASGTATTGKRLLLPILTAGLAMSRAMELDSYHLRLERARARLFPPSKWAGFFPSAAYRRSALPQLALGRLKWRCLGCLDADCVASQHRKTGLIFSLQLALSIHK